MNIVRIITALIIYLIYSFAEWDFNIANWGFFARLTFAILVIGSAVMWWILGQIVSDSKKPKEEKKESPSDIIGKSKFQQRLEELAEERKRKTNS
jgi:hypothetical protein